MKNDNKKLVVIEFNGPISEMGGISGPITNPVKLEIPMIIKLITAHRKVFEVNPNNYSQKVALTLQNVKLVNFRTVAKNNKSDSVIATKSNNTNNQNNKNEIKDDFSKKDKKSDFIKK